MYNYITGDGRHPVGVAVGKSVRESDSEKVADMKIMIFFQILAEKLNALNIVSRMFDEAKQKITQESETKSITKNSQKEEFEKVNMSLKDHEDQLDIELDRLIEPGQKQESYQD